MSPGLALYAADWLNLLLRWAHVITGIAWIGSSFYFIWLDASLNRPPRNAESEDVAGDLWAVHGGGFYHAQKYALVPGELPEPLHWFKWEAYFTWMTGFALLVVVYYLNADRFLVDPRVLDLGAGTAVAISIALLLVGWLVYDTLCRLLPSPAAFAVAGVLVLLATCFGVAQVFGGRGAYVQVGAMLGTIMAANVFRIIIPAQRALVAAKEAGSAPEATRAIEARRRSLHNNYLTLPVVFVMISPHYPMTYSHAYNWLVLFGIFAIGALTRHYFNLRHRRRHALALPAGALVAVFVLAVAVAPGESGLPDAGAAGDGAPALGEVRSIIEARCVPCHAASPSHPSAPNAAAGVILETWRDIAVWADRIYGQAVVTRAMPLANLTGITEEERMTLARWYAAGAPVDRAGSPR